MIFFLNGGSKAPGVVDEMNAGASKAPTINDEIPKASIALRLRWRRRNRGTLRFGSFIDIE